MSDMPMPKQRHPNCVNTDCPTCLKDALRLRDYLEHACGTTGMKVDMQCDESGICDRHAKEAGDEPI